MNTSLFGPYALVDDLNSPQYYESQLGTVIPSQTENQHLQPPATCIHAHSPTIRKTRRIRVLLQGLEDGPYDCDSDEGTTWFCGKSHSASCFGTDA